MYTSYNKQQTTNNWLSLCSLCQPSHYHKYIDTLFIKLDLDVLAH